MDQSKTPSTDHRNHAAPSQPQDFLRSGGRVDALRESAAHQCAHKIGEDILRGAYAIADFLYDSKDARRKVYRLVQQRKLPHFRLGATICARKSVLLGWVAAQETGTVISSYAK